MMRACIDAFDKELAKVEKLAATYAAEWSARKVVEFSRQSTRGKPGCD
jgi:hypothetical protein